MSFVLKCTYSLERAFPIVGSVPVSWSLNFNVLCVQFKYVNLYGNELHLRNGCLQIYRWVRSSRNYQNDKVIIAYVRINRVSNMDYQLKSLRFLQFSPNPFSCSQSNVCNVLNGQIDFAHYLNRVCAFPKAAELIFSLWSLNLNISYQLYHIHIR